MAAAAAMGNRGRTGKGLLQTRHTKGVEGPYGSYGSTAARWRTDGGLPGGSGKTGAAQRRFEAVVRRRRAGRAAAAV